MRRTSFAPTLPSVQSVVIYTLQGCPYCVRAKGLLDSKRSDYKEIDVTADRDARGLVCSLSGHRTFPQIFVGDAFIGGCDELCALDRAGMLDAMLA